MLSVFSGRPGRHFRFFSLALLSFASLGAPPSLAQDESSEILQEPLQLDDISVTANMVPTEKSKVGSSVTRFTGEELEERRTRLVSDVLREVPGVAVNRTGPVGQLTQVRIRGSEGNQTLVLIDGMRVNDPSAGSEFDFAHLLAEEVERVEVLRGPQSALYGSDALGGVINIVTRSGSREPEARIKAEEAPSIRHWAMPPSATAARNTTISSVAPASVPRAPRWRTSATVMTKPTATKT
ncbi:TonB-dependent receptor [Fodinicurvata halophila]|uniref:TonB-dependent receptor n=1 Tax=Fodinicurvata halophila TaxID=1419723 RepID=UPI00363D8AB5